MILDENDIEEVLAQGIINKSNTITKSSHLLHEGVHIDEIHEFSLCNNIISKYVIKYVVNDDKMNKIYANNTIKHFNMKKRKTENIAGVPYEIRVKIQLDTQDSMFSAITKGKKKLRDYISKNIAECESRIAELNTVSSILNSMERT